MNNFTFYPKWLVHSTMKILFSLSPIQGLFSLADIFFSLNYLIIFFFYVYFLAFYTHHHSVRWIYMSFFYIALGFVTVNMEKYLDTSLEKY